VLGKPRCCLQARKKEAPNPIYLILRGGRKEIHLRQERKEWPIMTMTEIKKEDKAHLSTRKPHRKGESPLRYRTGEEDSFFVREKKGNIFYSLDGKKGFNKKGEKGWSILFGVGKPAFNIVGGEKHE